MLVLFLGGSLKARIEGHPGTLEQLHDWGLEVLRGLTYLHDNGLRHGKIHANRVMFAGPGNGRGTLKLISLPFRLERTIIAPVTGYKTGIVDPALNSRKSDTVDYAHLLAHIINGHPLGFNPETKLPLISDMYEVPQLVTETLKQCCQPYENRPLTCDLLAGKAVDGSHFIGLFNTEEYKNHQITWEITPS